MVIVAIVALIVVGPKDLPVMFRRAGEFVGKMRGMAREFSRAMNDAADEAGVRDVQAQIKAATNPVGTAMDGVKDAAKSIANPLDDVDPSSNTGKLSAERAAQKAEIEAKTARLNAERMQKDAEAALKRAEELEAQSTVAKAPDASAEKST